MTAPDRTAPLREYLGSAHRVARRLVASVDRIATLFPLDPGRIAALSDGEAERLDAFLHRYASLAAIVQDHVGRALLLAEEENVADASRKDQRLLLEKLGATRPGLDFGAIAKLRNRLVHSYPDDPRRQADVLNEAFTRSPDLIEALDDLTTYAARKFRLDLDLPPLARRP